MAILSPGIQPIITYSNVNLRKLEIYKKNLEYIANLHGNSEFIDIRENLIFR